jgi:hypothetical protein
MSFFSNFFIPAAVKATDDPRAKIIFHKGNFLFSIDADRGASESSFPYYLGLTGQSFNIETVAQYVQRYASAFGYSSVDVANAYADFAKRIAQEKSEFYGERDLYVKAWLNQTSRGTEKGWEKDENHSFFLDFSTYFLLDTLELKII